MYKLSYLLDRAYDQLEKVEETKCSAINQPQINRKNKKTYIGNFIEISGQLNRPPDHFKSYIDDELCCSTSIDGIGSLVCQGIFNDIGLHKIIAQYIKKYVQCSECKSINTSLIKKNRISFIDCSKCKSVKAI